jgi:CAAX prenyl protease-like protein
MVDTRAEPRRASLREGRSATAYAAPIVVFGVLTGVEGLLPAGAYPVFYIVKIAVVTATLAYFRGPLGDIRPSWAVVPLGAAVGLVVFAEWVLLDHFVPYPHLGTRVGYNPFEAIDEVGARWAFLVARFYGLVLVVPVMEELFWRSFLLRYATTADFTSLAVGQFSMTAFWIVVALSAVAHPEWLVAAIASALFAWLLHHTRSLFAVIVSHAVTNSALGGYILIRGQWQYW